MWVEQESNAGKNGLANTNKSKNLKNIFTSNKKKTSSHHSENYSREDARHADGHTAELKPGAFRRYPFAFAAKTSEIHQQQATTNLHAFHRNSNQITPKTC